nr:MAG TPA: hypothetical protein [Caudoviricetes sp.]
MELLGKLIFHHMLDVIYLKNTIQNVKYVDDLK